jgi:hypothetical protein
MTHQANPWKTAQLVVALCVPLSAIGVAVELLVDAGARSAAASAPTSHAGAPAPVVDDCNRLAEQAPRDTTRQLRDVVFGGAGAALANGRAIGTVGTLHGLSQKNRKSEYAVAAYRQCMARRGWF